VRICDCASRRCVSIIDLQEEQLLQESDLAELLRCAKSPPVTCVKFDAGGNWLVAGSGQVGLGSEQQGALTLWNCSLNAAAKHRSTGKCMPQVGGVLEVSNFAQFSVVRLCRRACGVMVACGTAV
jgi:hypothetical protein